MVIWITGITASGKTSIGTNLHKSLITQGRYSSKHIDGDLLRRRKDWVSGHSIESRKVALKKIVDVCLEEQKSADIVIVSTVSHLISMRKYARSKLEKFHEIFLDVGPDICAMRDYKKLYEKAFNNEFSCFPGVTEEYQKYDEFDLALSTGVESLETCSKVLLSYVQKQILIANN